MKRITVLVLAVTAGCSWPGDRGVTNRQAGKIQETPVAGLRQPDPPPTEPGAPPEAAPVRRDPEPSEPAPLHAAAPVPPLARETGRAVQQIRPVEPLHPVEPVRLPPAPVAVPIPQPPAKAAPPPAALETARPPAVVVITRPEEPAPPPPRVAPAPPAPVRYSGPREGTLVVSARLDKGEQVVVCDESAPCGLPGVPVTVEFDSRRFAMAIAPSPANGWKKLVLRSRDKVHAAISVRWSVLE